MGEKKKSHKANKQGSKCGGYKLRNTRERNKVVRVARSNGYQAALDYADKYMLRSWAKDRLKNFTFGRDA